MSNIRSLTGGPVPERKPHENWIKELENALERARSGESVGGVLCDANFHGHTAWYAAGAYVSFSMIGAIEAAKVEVALQTRDQIEDL